MASNPIPKPPDPAQSQQPPALFDRLRMALLEDLGTPDQGDVTSTALIPEDLEVEGIVLAKAPGVVCGVNLLTLVFQMAEELVSAAAQNRAWEVQEASEAALQGQATWQQVGDLAARKEGSAIRVKAVKKDGARVAPGDVVAEVRGNARALLAGERVALNLLCHLSGVATATMKYVEAVQGTSAKIVDTRKTTPLWRDLEKYAVKCGGGVNHRLALHDMVLIKDNHLALWGSGGPAMAANVAKARYQGKIPVMIEVTDLRALAKVCRESAPDYILLDNFDAAGLTEAVGWCQRWYKDRGERPLLEASGGVTLENVKSVAESGVDRISIGALTHSVRALDLSLELKKISGGATP